MLSPDLCGDGERDPGEGCDDGNELAGDGCSSRCAIEDDFACMRSGQCASGFCLGTCRARHADQLTTSAAFPNPTDQFGESIAIAGNFAVVGAPAAMSCESLATSDCQTGAAYIYEYDGTQWFETARLLPPAGDDFDFFGTHVAITNDIAVVSAWNEASCAQAEFVDNHCPRAGAVYVYRRDQSEWSYQATLKADNAEAYDGFGGFHPDSGGVAVAVDAGVVVVGARHEDGCQASQDIDDNACASAGAAYVFRYDATQAVWYQQARLKAPNAGAGDQFGGAVAVHDDTLVIGAAFESSCSDTTYLSSTSYDDNDDCRRSGAAYIYEYDGAAWYPVAILKPRGDARHSLFASSVDVWGSRIGVGAPDERFCGLDSLGCGRAGSVSIFERGQNGWQNHTLLVASNPREGDSFGTAVSLTPDSVFVGAPGQAGCHGGINGFGASTSCPNAGAVYAFHYRESEWFEAGFIKATAPIDDARFGTRVSADDAGFMIRASDAVALYR